MERSIEIKAPPEKVWAMLAQDRHLEWFEGYKSAVYTSKVDTPEDKYRVGSSAHVIATHDEFDITITESLENEKIAYGIQVKGGEKWVRNTTQTYTLKPMGVGTELTWEMEWEIPNLIMRMIDKLLMSILGKGFKKSLENLKSILEE